MAINIFLSVLILTRLVIGLRLLITGRKNKLPNLFWLSASMFITIIVLVFSAVPGNPLGNLPVSPWVFVIGSLLGIATLIVFNQLTFYKDRQRNLTWVWVFFGIFSALTIYGLALSTPSYQFPLGVAYIVGAMFVWAWHGWLAGQSLSKIASERSVHDWVKARYKLMITYSLVLMIGSVASAIRYLFFIDIQQSTMGGLLSLVVLIGQIVSVILLFLVWAMPESFRLWLNRNYQTRIDEEFHEQALAIMDILGTSMTKGTKLPKTLALVAIRKTIGREINTEDSRQINQHVIGLGYDDWSRFLSNPELHTFFREVANVSPREVVENARQTLIENQSLFTLQAK